MKIEHYDLFDALSIQNKEFWEKPWEEKERALFFIKAISEIDDYSVLSELIIYADSVSSQCFDFMFDAIPNERGRFFTGNSSALQIVKKHMRMMAAAGNAESQAARHDYMKKLESFKNED